MLNERVDATAKMTNRSVICCICCKTTQNVFPEHPKLFPEADKFNVCSVVNCLTAASSVGLVNVRAEH